MRRAFSRVYDSLRDHLGFRTKLMTFPSYEAYRSVQIEGNKQKIGCVFAKEANIAHACHYLESELGTVSSVLCHGTRNGAEQRWFRKYLEGTPIVLGTEISDNAHEFPDTVQWDFHELNPEWVGRWDVIYSNSWDHAFDPEKAFSTWLSCLSPRGLLLLEHSTTHEPSKVRELDPFGASRNGLVEMLNRLAGPARRVVAILDDLPERNKRQSFVIVGPAGRS